MTTAADTATGDTRDRLAREYLGKLLERHLLGASENDIRSAFRDFLLRTGIAADESEIVTETRPAADSRHKVDLYLRNTYVEFKKSIISGGVIDPKAIEQLDGYILENAQAGNGIQNGILTDGRHYLKRSVGDNLRALVIENSHRMFNSPDQGSRLYEYLYDIVDTQAEDIAPTPQNLLRYFGQDSDFFKTATALLTETHRKNRDHPTVAVKRKLWRELLQVSIGQNAVDDSPRYDDLFLRHTYLTALVGVIVQAHFGIDVARYADAEPENLLNGEILRQHTGLKGITESDLFTWPLETGQRDYLRTIARQVAKLQWQDNPDDLAATLYQNTITAEERKRMGEYYTPSWLAQAITEELVTDPANARVLDPSCGSGTFLAAAVRHLIAHAGDLTPGEQLARLQENVAGIDLHPVAVQLAKATWVIASRDVIMAARSAGQSAETITAPVYLGDSMQLRHDSSQLDGQGYITLDTRETLPGQTGNIEFRIPLSLARDTERFDGLMLEISAAIEKGDETVRILNNYGVTGGPERETMQATIANMRALHDDKRNHVWAYYLRNMTRPTAIAERKVDAIIGNPPWLTYNQSADIIREELKSLSENRYRIWAGGKNAPHQDVATLFYCRAAELYLKEQGRIGMVLPHSVLRTGHHLRFRSAYYEAKNPPRSRQPKRAFSLDFSVKAPWDLDNLDPNNFFPIASCVVFAQLNGHWGGLGENKIAAKPLAPGMVEIWSGSTDTPYVPRRLRPGQVHVIGSTGTADAERLIAPLIHNDGIFHSPYAEFANQGPTITDRRLYFVTAHPNENRFAPPDTFVTYPRTGNLDKKTYSVAELEGQIVSGDNLFSVYLGESLAPYVALRPLTAALPVSKAAMTMPLDHTDCEELPNGFIKHNACEVDRQGLDANMRARWEKMERLWEANRGQADTKSLSQNLNWLNKLTSQLEYLRYPSDRPVRIAYTTSGRPTAALVPDSQAIVDTKLYQVPCRNLDEAHYLLAIINSLTLEYAIKDFRPKGLYGERDLHKHLWKLPIPEYDADNETRAALSRLGKTAAQEAEAVMAELTARNGEDWSTTANARSSLRNGWQRSSPAAQAIEAAVRELLAAGR
jgi:hypothetical protein